ncbi:1427_t:CDS:2 [Diversispora eburnea]|uniref:1427_t:CDS:1 n=1 Tax=Diversispora eburnea TaxID=1213867 RepID=A0A9N8W6C9_9GLOM|nr:1427_t:CDS:2 [Diversispora eburnea]
MSDKVNEIKENVKSAMPSAPAQVQQPPDVSLPEKIASPMSTISAHYDPYPHYFMSAASFVGAGYAYQSMKQPKTAAIAAIIGAAYGAAGIQSGDTALLLVMASVALIATSGPAAWAAKDPYHSYHVALASLGSVSTAANIMNVYKLETGKPREMEVKAEVKK